MNTHLRGLVMLIVGAIGVIANIIDAFDDGFSVWNAIAIVCFVVVLIYGYLYVTERRTIRR